MNVMGMEFKLSFDEQKKRDLWCDVYARAIGDGCSDRYAADVASQAVEDYEKRFENCDER